MNTNGFFGALLVLSLKAFTNESFFFSAGLFFLKIKIIYVRDVFNEHFPSQSFLTETTIMIFKLNEEKKKTFVLRSRPKRSLRGIIHKTLRMLSDIYC